MDIIITNSILGIKEETVSPYNDEISKCFRLGLISSNFIFRIIIAVIKPTVNVQNKILIMVFKDVDVINLVMDCNQ